MNHGLTLIIEKMKELSDAELKAALRFAKTIAKGPDPTATTVMQVVEGQPKECHGSDAEKAINSMLLCTNIVGTIAAAVIKDEMERRKKGKLGFWAKHFPSLFGPKPTAKKPKKNKFQIDVDRLEKMFQ